MASETEYKWRKKAPLSRERDRQEIKKEIFPEEKRERKEIKENLLMEKEKCLIKNFPSKKR